MEQQIPRDRQRQDLPNDAAQGRFASLAEAQHIAFFHAPRAELGPYPAGDRDVRPHPARKRTGQQLVPRERRQRFPRLDGELFPAAQQGHFFRPADDGERAFIGEADAGQAQRRFQRAGGIRIAGEPVREQAADRVHRAAPRHAEARESVPFRADGEGQKAFFRDLDHPSHSPVFLISIYVSSSIGTKRTRSPAESRDSVFSSNSVKGVRPMMFHPPGEGEG